MMSRTLEAFLPSQANRVKLISGGYRDPAAITERLPRPPFNQTGETHTLAIFWVFSEEGKAGTVLMAISLQKPWELMFLSFSPFLLEGNWRATY